jgi:DNA-binding NarL/FixJ family response regulator
LNNIAFCGKLITSLVHLAEESMSITRTDVRDVPVPHVPSIRILLADDHPVVRDGIRNRLAREEDFVVAGEAANGEEAIRQARRLSPDVVLLDVAMPGPGPVPVMEALHQAVPAAKVLVLSAFDDDEYVFGMLAAGAAGYALKDERLSTLVEAIRAVARGETWLSPRVASKVTHRAVGQESEAAGTPLTEREQEVLRLMAEGRENVEIAGALVISERTVKFHVGNIYTKLGATSRTAAVVEAIRRGWVRV